MFVYKPWGFEFIIVNNELYCLKRIVIKKGKTSSGGKYHYHTIKDETFVVLAGVLSLDIDGKTVSYTPGDRIRIKPGQRHRFSAPHGNCIFLEVSTHHEDSDSYYD